MTSPHTPYAYAQTYGLLWKDHRLLLNKAKDGWLQRACVGDFLRQHGPLRVDDVEEPLFLEQLQDVLPTNDGNTASAIHAAQADMDLSRLLIEMPTVTDLMDMTDDGPVVKMVNTLLQQAVRDGASDIHIEPYEAHSQVRMRVDGVLRDVVQVNRAVHGALVSRLKVMAELDIAEKRLPQDGRIGIRLGALHAVDIRVSTLPTAHGERAVLRVLDKKAGVPKFASLGIEPTMYAAITHALQAPHGIILVTGPTGSGKTTTLYSALATMDAKRLNILTVEDPIEYEMPGIGQTQVNSKIGHSFAGALRSILRQDPDVILIGEIRDKETAQIAVQAALTGHLVLATLHTNDAPSAISRLVDMQVDPTLLASSLTGVLAQRLVRKLCVACHGEGCHACGLTGYQGRLGVFEWMGVSTTMRGLIHGNASQNDMKTEAARHGWRPLHEDGQRHIIAGMTSHDEVVRVTQEDAT